MPKDDDDGKDVPVQSIALALERLARLMRAGEHGEGLNPAQWEALRYLSRANRFSNAPGALTKYLGATKGTISQTVMALERKGLIAKSKRESEKRSVILVLTPKGEAILANDPWNRLLDDCASLGNKTRRRLAKGLKELLDEELKRGNHPSFGLCGTCRFFREKGRDTDLSGPHLCMLFDQPLSQVESLRICAEHETA